MTAFILFLLEASICLLVLGGCYHLSTRKLTFYGIRRSLLILLLLFCVLIPVIEYPWIHANEPTLGSMSSMVDEWEVQFQEAVEIIPFVSNLSVSQETSKIPLSISFAHLLLIFYLIGVSIYTFRLSLSFWKIRSLLKTYQPVWKGSHWFAETDLPHSFSFASVLFMAQAHMKLPQKEYQQILEHELAHIQQKHSIDLLFVEFFGLLFWFHPLLPYFKRELKQIHECLADQAVLQLHSPFEYGRLLLKLAIQKQELSLKLIHPFAYVSLKNRIIMMNNVNSSKWKLLLLFPVFMVLSAMWVLISPSLAKMKAEVTPIINQQIVAATTGIQSQIVPDMWPIKGGKMVSGFGMRKNPYTQEKQMHTGIDISAKTGTPVLSAGEGVVHSTGFDKKKGKFIEIKHGDTYQTNYFHLVAISVEAGDKISKGQQIAKSGNTGLSKGPHLHFEIWEGEKAIDPTSILKSETPSQTYGDVTPNGAPLKNGKILSGFGMRNHPVLKTKKFHSGVDYEAPMETPIYATGKGKVSLAEDQKEGYGIHIILQHANEYETLYAHLSSASVKVGDEVEKGMLIGYTGNSGLSQKPHLHYSIKKNGKFINPANLLP